MPAGWVGEGCLGHRGCRRGRVVKAAPVAGDANGAGSVTAAPAIGAGSVKAGPAAGQLMSAPVAVGKARFVGVSWPAPAVGPPANLAGKVWLRARTDIGWSGWRAVEPAADGADANTAEYRRSERVYSDGLWLDAGTAQVQIRVDRPAGPAPRARPVPAPRAGPALAPRTRPRPAPVLRPAARRPPGPWCRRPGCGAHLITPDMTATPGTEAPRAGEATAATARPTIVSRKGWGAVESLRRAAPDYSSTVKAAVIHHTVQTNRYAPSESAALVRADYLYHVRSRGWNDVGYNFLVDHYGRVFEGRYGGITRGVLGAHAGGFNTYTTGVALLGTFSSSRPPAAMLASLKRLLAWKLDLSTWTRPARRPCGVPVGPTSATRPGARSSPAPSSGTVRPRSPTARGARPSTCCAPSARPCPGSAGPRSTGVGCRPGGSSPSAGCRSAWSPASAPRSAGGSPSPGPTGPRRAPSPASAPRPGSAGVAAPPPAPCPRRAGRR